VASLRIRGAAIPLDRSNVDTDLIIPSRYMKAVTREALGAGVFEALRNDPANLFDDPRYRGAPILVAGANFGCGSSREHAVWALLQMGIEAVIAPSFGEIFEANALRNGLVAVRLPAQQVETLLRLAPGDTVTIDVEQEVVRTPGGEAWPFALDPFRKRCLVEGLDDIDITTRMEPEIAAFEARMFGEQPWLDPDQRQGSASDDLEPR
jgi:3-isopropylmalate/(R)-2-methylmalate dehydratase small subunit